MAVLLIVWVMFAGLGWWIAGQKRRSPEEGFILGLVFGPIGCLIEAVLPVGETEKSKAVEAVRRFEEKIKNTR